MLGRADYTTCVPPETDDISGNIIPTADIAGRTPCLRREDEYYLHEFLARTTGRVGYGNSSGTRAFYTGYVWHWVANQIGAMDDNAQTSPYRCAPSGVIGYLTGSLSAATYNGKGSGGAIDSLLAAQRDTYVSGLHDNESHLVYRRPITADILRRAYRWLDRKSKCWRIVEYSSGMDVAAKYWMGYVSGLDGLGYKMWRSGAASAAPVATTVTMGASRMVGRYTTSGYDATSSTSCSAYQLFRVSDNSQSGSPHYIKSGGLMNDTYITVAMDRGDVTEAFALVEYIATISGSIKYMTKLVPFEKTGDHWKAKIWERSVAPSLLMANGYDITVIDGGEVDSSHKTASVYSQITGIVYKVDDKACLPSEWTWQPSN